MELTISQAVKKGIEAHRAGRIQEADRYYTAILKEEPKNPEVNHNLGVLAISIGKTQESLPFLETALEVNPERPQFWHSYINALIKLDKLADAKKVFVNYKNKGFEVKNLFELDAKIVKPSETKTQNYNTKKSQSKILDTLKLDQALRLAKSKAKDGSKKEADKIYKEILAKFPKNKKAINGIQALSSELFYKKSKAQDPHKVQMQALMNLYSVGQFKEALSKASRLLSEFPISTELYNFIGSTNTVSYTHLTLPTI